MKYLGIDYGKKIGTALSGNYAIRLDADGWTFKTADKSLAAHFEHTVVIWKDRAEVLTRL